jgi:hypothetical protein
VFLSFNPVATDQYPPFTLKEVSYPASLMCHILANCHAGEASGASPISGVAVAPKP